MVVAWCGGGVRVSGKLRMAYPPREAAPQQAEAVSLVNLTHEGANSMHFSRISKLLVDRDDLSIKDALAFRKGQKVALVCGPDVGGSYTLQVAVLTAAALIERCFPGAMRVVLDDRLAASPLLPWRSMDLTFEQALTHRAQVRDRCFPVTAVRAAATLLSSLATQVRRTGRCASLSTAGSQRPVRPTRLIDCRNATTACLRASSPRRSRCRRSSCPSRASASRQLAARSRFLSGGPTPTSAFPTRGVCQSSFCRARCGCWASDTLAMHICGRWRRCRIVILARSKSF